MVLIVADDQRAESLSGMTQVRRLLTDRGMRFSRAMVPTALCCPSRSSILTGLYAHNTRVYGNGRAGGPRFGGWAQVHRQGLESRTIAVTLQRAGYRTGLFGKYLNDFSRLSPDGYRPPGWHRFLTFERPNAAYIRYRLTDGSWHGSGPEDYSTDVLARRARAFIEDTPQGKPLFLVYTPYGPHRPYRPAPRDEFAPVVVPETNGNMVGGEDLVSVPHTLWPPPRSANDNPTWMARRSVASTGVAERLGEAQTRVLLSVDDAVGTIVRTMRREGRIRNTLFIYMSDNGYLWGEHGLVGKDAPYAAATRVPLVVRWDGHVAAGGVDRRLAVNVDIAATISKAAGVHLPADGLDLLSDRRRNGFVLEAMPGNRGRPAYCGWRSPHHMYVRWATGREELYDYRVDPGERNNLADYPRYRPIADRMRARAVEACRPEPPGFDW